MRFLTDECVQDSVGDYLASRGHDVERARDIFAPKTPDPVVTKRANDDSAIVVTNNSKDYKRLISRMSPAGPQQFPHAGRLLFEHCEGPIARDRLEQVIDWVEFEYVQCQRRKDKRLMMAIRKDTVLIHR